MRIGRLLRAGRGRPASLAPDRLDAWLEHLYGEQLRPSTRPAPAAGRSASRCSADLDTDLWALLLTQEYDAYPNIRALLPSVPEPRAAGAVERDQRRRAGRPERGVLRPVARRFARHGDRALAERPRPGLRVRLGPADAPAGARRRARPPLRLRSRRADPRRLPGGPRAGARSRASSSSPTACRSRSPSTSPSRSRSSPTSPRRRTSAALRALHGALRPGAILVVTVRPPDYLRLSPLMRPALESLGPDPDARLRESRHLFVAHPAQSSHPQYDGGEMTYGEAVITAALRPRALVGEVRAARRRRASSATSTR